MIIVLLSVGVLACLGYNHLEHGPGCWGFQPGGRWSSSLFDLQALLAILGIISCLYWLLVGKGNVRVVMTAIILVLAVLAVWQYKTTGWRMHTSIHHQGTENLPTFLLTSFTALLGGGFSWWMKRRRTVAGD